MASLIIFDNKLDCSMGDLIVARNAVSTDKTSLVSGSDWDSLPLDVLASVALHLRPKYIADARLVCKSWCRGVSLGVKHLQPKLQSPLGGRSGSLAGLYVYAMRWHEMPLLLVSFNDTK